MPYMPTFAVTTGKGPAWDRTAGIRNQRLWNEHASFADGLVDKGVIVLGGPVQDDDDDVIALIAVRANDAEEVRSVFACDPWVEEGLLVLRQVRPWTIWLDQSSCG